MPSLSVVLPVYNGERFIRAAIASVLSQTFEDFELIIINDGSTDGSGEIIRSFAEVDKRIKFLSRENKGLIYTLNEACAMASSGYLVRMDADDMCVPKRLQLQYQYMEENPHCSALGGRVVLIDEADDPIKEMGTHLTHEEIDQEHLGGRGGAIIHPAAIFRKTCFEKVGGYRADFTHAEDLDLFLRLAEVGTISNLKDIVLYYRQHLSSIGYSNRREQAISARAAVSSALNRRGLELVNVNEIALKEDVDLYASYLKWAWWAQSGGNIQTARKYALKSLKLRPYSIDTWRLIYCCFLRRQGM